MLASSLRKSLLIHSALFRNRKSIAVHPYLRTRAFATQVKKTGDGPVEYVNITFINKDKSETPIKAKVGESLLEIAHENGIDLEGACEASIACSTCHVILQDDIFEKLEPATPEEEDMLDLAFGLTANSRLGCQIRVDKRFEGQKITLPKATRNMYVDGAKAKHH